MITAHPPYLRAEKQVAHLYEFELACGRLLEKVTIGYETYGRLNEARDNAILICHFFSGSSHAAGRYHPEDAAPGWWDAIIGPAKAIDTDRYYVIAMDALGCVRVDAPHAVTTGPATIDPMLGRSYGPDFPPLVVADTVRAHRAVLRQLGITKLAAVAGPSYGAMQALEWATLFPEEVERVIAAIGLSGFQAREMGLYRVMLEAIRLDPKFRGGYYAPDSPPNDGLAVASGLMIMLSSGREQLQAAFGRRPAEVGSDPASEADSAWAIEEWLARETLARASFCDANAWISMLRTNMAWDLAAGHGSLEKAAATIQARVLLLPALGDELADMPHHHDPLHQALRAAGKDVTVTPLPAANGHLAGLLDIAQAAPAIRACLEQA